MRNITSKILVVVLFCTATFSGLYAQGIAFNHDSFSAAVKAAAQERKLVFMDCYTSWCGPCKMLARDVFTNDTVGDFFNKHFVCVKVDMEKEDGPELARRFQVRAYPTLLFINSDDMNVAYRLTGGRRGTQWLVEAGEKALDSSSNLIGLAEAYAKNKQDTVIVAKYLSCLSETSSSVLLDSVLSEYLQNATVVNKCSEATWKMLERYVKDPYSSWFEYLYSHASDFAAVVGPERVGKKLFDTYYYAVMGFIKRKRIPEKQFPRSQFDKLFALLKDYKGRDADFFRAEMTMVECVQCSDYKRMMDELDECERRGILSSAETRFYFVWLNLTYLCESDDASTISRGLKWAEIIHPLMSGDQMEKAWQSMVQKLKNAKIRK